MPIEVLSRADDVLIEALTGILADSVEGGASLGFMAPLDLDQGRDFWADSLTDVIAGNRTILVAFDDNEKPVGTVHLVFSSKPNAAHRAEVEKLMVSSQARRQGIGRSLMLALERAARQLNKRLLILDTETGSIACSFYEAMGWQLAGTVPGYAYRPHGGLGDTSYYFKHLGEGA